MPHGGDLARYAAMAHKKTNLPTKTCAACQRPFAWRKKWQRDWDNVRYCSDRCRRQGGQQPERERS